MGLFNKYFKNEKTNDLSVSYSIICYQAAEQIKKNDIPHGARESFGDDHYDELMKENDKYKLESLIISMVLFGYRLKDIEKSDMSLYSYCFDHNPMFKKVIILIIKSLVSIPDVISGIVKWKGRRINSDEIFYEIYFYFCQRFSEYEQYIGTLVLSLDPSEKTSCELNISQLYNNPYLHQFELDMFNDRDFYFDDKQRDDLSSEAMDLIYTIYKAKDFIINNVR